MGQHLEYDASYKGLMMALQPLGTHPISYTKQERQTEARVGTFNFSADHGDRFCLQRAHEETEKDGGGRREVSERPRERERIVSG